MIRENPYGFYDLLMRASRGEIKVCVTFDWRLADPNCDDPRKVEDVKEN